MSILTRADNAQVHWLVDDAPNKTLGPNHAVLYVPRMPVKLGQVTRDSAQGLTPQKTFEERYSGSKSLADDDIQADDLFVIPKTRGQDFDYDNSIRRLIHHLHKQGKCPFDALYPGYQKTQANSEALLGYDRAQHLTTLTQIIKQYFKLGEYFDTRDQLTWRWKQQEDIDLILAKLREHHLCLFAAYTSRGKTKISMEVAHQLLPQGGIVLVTTPISDTKKSFEENCVNWHFGANRSLQTTYMDSQAFGKANIRQLRERAANNELIFVVLTVQDLRWGESQLTEASDAGVDKLRKKYQALSKHVDLWIRDERHSQYNGFVTSQRLAEMKADHVLDLTATPYNCYNKYDAQHILARTLLWGLRNQAHTRLPSIAIDAISGAGLKLVPELEAVYQQEEGYDPRKLFQRENQNFVMQQEIVTLANQFYTNSRSRKKNPLSITNDTSLSDSAKLCGLWVLPQGQQGDGASDYLPALAHMLNTRADPGVFYIDSYDVEYKCGKSQTISSYVDQLIATHGRVVILTCGKFLTGTDIPSLGHIVLWDRMDSVANFEQLLGRMIREYPGKTHTKLYALAPGMSVAVTLGRMAQKNAELGGGTEYEVLDCVPLSEYGNTGYRQLAADEILEQTQNWFQSHVRDRLPSVSVWNMIQRGHIPDNWHELDLKKFRNILPRTQLTDDTGAKVRAKVAKGGKNNKAATKSDLDEIENIVRILQNVIFEVQWVAYSQDNWNWQHVITNEAILGMFGEDVVEAVVETIHSNPELESMIQEHLSTKQQAYKNLDPEQVFGELFGNSKLKQSIGLVYVPWKLAEELVNALP